MNTNPKKNLQFIHPFLNGSLNSKSKKRKARHNSIPNVVKITKWSRSKSFWVGAKSLIQYDPLRNITITCDEYGKCQVWRNHKRIISLNLPYYGKKNLKFFVREVRFY